MIDLGYNERRLLEILRGKGGMSRIELAREMDVSAPTLTRLTANLLESGLILEAEEARSDGKRGKPSTAIEINPNGLFTLGVYFNPDDLRVCLADLNGTIRQEIRSELEGHSFEHIMEMAETAARQVVEKAKIKKKDVLGCGISFPGHFKRDRGHVFRIKQFESWRDIDVDKDFQP
ncbi:MAG TPA: sugar kinase, partial [Agrobacterium sp.]|nr:sugar kinase [Agrobacterium sp.]